MLNIMLLAAVVQASVCTEASRCDHVWWRAGFARTQHRKSQIRQVGCCSAMLMLIQTGVLAPTLQAIFPSLGCPHAMFASHGLTTRCACLMISDYHLSSLSHSKQHLVSNDCKQASSSAIFERVCKPTAFSTYDLLMQSTAEQTNQCA